MSRARVAIATCADFPELNPDDRPLLAALERRGIEAVPVVWDGGELESERFDGCLLRSTWDYHEKLAAFLTWARRVNERMPLWNPHELVAWNAEKSYLRELAAAGVPTIPTRWLERDGGHQLDALLAEEGWEEAVLKPAVDLGARRLRRARAGDPAGQSALAELLAAHDVMVQPFLPSVETEGELSLVYIGGRFSHAVRKVPKEGDFRVQPSWGGSVHPAEAAAADLEIGELALSHLPADPLYARVDLVAGAAGESLLIELELIEPLLFLTKWPRAVEDLADVVLAQLHGRGG
jgi:glutathione synthase/RimK-type ligase-like ATP-grasp enzyme